MDAAQLDSLTSNSQPRPSRLGKPSIRFVPANETRPDRPAVRWEAMTRILDSPNDIIPVGRYSDSAMQHYRTSSTAPVGFKSKVVSRFHAEVFYRDDQWYIRDIGSSSGTFVNHQRLSKPGDNTGLSPINDGDLVQLGIDFKGGEEVIFRCIRMRIEINRDWQKSLNAFNTNAHAALIKKVSGHSKADDDAASIGATECSICLHPIGPIQSLFVAPCNHCWHFKCIRTMLQGPNYPHFLCPNCRMTADLEADPIDYAEEIRLEASREQRRENTAHTVSGAESHGDIIPPSRNLSAEGDFDFNDVHMVDEPTNIDGVPQPESTSQDENAVPSSSSRSPAYDREARRPSVNPIPITKGPNNRQARRGRSASPAAEDRNPLTPTR
jgi:E3 ubiquitin-protein ligase DMA1/2